MKPITYANTTQQIAAAKAIAEASTGASIFSTRLEWDAAKKKKRVATTPPENWQNLGDKAAAAFQRALKNVELHRHIFAAIPATLGDGFVVVDVDEGDVEDVAGRLGEPAARVPTHRGKGWHLWYPCDDAGEYGPENGLEFDGGLVVDIRAAHGMIYMWDCLAVNDALDKVRDDHLLTRDALDAFIRDGGAHRQKKQKKEHEGEPLKGGRFFELLDKELGIKGTGKRDRKGNEVYSCLHPEHEDATPSCSVMNDGRWHCFSKGHGGNAYTLLVTDMKMDAGKAIALLDKYGLNIGGLDDRVPEAKRAEWMTEAMEANPITDNAHFVVRGTYGKKQVAVQRRRTGEVIYEQQQNLAKLENLVRFAPNKFWRKNYIKDDDKGLTRNILLNIASDIMDEALRVGVFREEDNLGYGLFRDGRGRLMLNLGSAAYDVTERRTYQHGELVGKTDLTFNIDKTRPPPSDAPEGRELLLEATRALTGWECEDYRGYRFARETDGIAFCGWHYAALLAGALDWRPHIWLTALAASGKSWLIRHYSRPLLREWGKFASAVVTQAGLRTLGAEMAGAFVFDEAESNTRTGKERLAELEPVVKAASTGDDGSLICSRTEDGKLVRQQVRLCLMFSSVNKTLMDTAGETRVTPIHFTREPHPHDVWVVTEKRIRKVMTRKNATHMVGAIFHGAEEIMEYIERARNYVMESGSSTRAADQISVLAGAFAWAAKASPEGCAALLMASTSDEIKKAGAESDNLLVTLEDLLVRVDPAQIEEQRPTDVALGTLIHRGEELYEYERYALMKMGVAVVKVDGELVVRVHGKSDNLQRALPGKYARVDMHDLLTKVKNATENKKYMKMFRKGRRHTIDIPLKEFPSYGIEPEEDEDG